MRAYEEGADDHEAARLLGMGRVSTFTTWRRSRFLPLKGKRNKGPPKRKAGRPRWNEVSHEEERRRMAAFLEAGSTAEAARRLGAPYHLVYHWAQDRGLLSALGPTNP